jgi:phosphatidylinositol alpha-1,6-mannosyltransferase
MKILYITTGCFDKGGISRYNRYQITACRELFGSDQIKVFSLLGPSDNDFEDPFSVDWHGTSANAKSKMGLVRQVLKAAFQWKPDLILCAHVNLSGLTYLASRFCGAQTVLNAYGLEIWSPLSRDASWGLRNVKYIISDCHNTAAWLINKMARKEKSIKVIWDCIDLDKFRPQPVSAGAMQKYRIPDPQEYFTILSLGRLSLPDALYKGYDRLLGVFADLAFKYDRLRLIIAGRGNYVEHLKKIARDKGMEDKVLFTGSVDEEDMAALYNSCSIFSLITDAGEGKGEGIPLTPLEAMACGKPVLVGNQDGSREAIIGNNGFAMDPFDLEAHKQAIVYYLENPGALQSHSVKALEVARDYFSYEHFKQKHWQFFCGISEN